MDSETEDFSWSDIGDLVVDGDGTATLALDEWVGGLLNARTLSLPAVQGDPQKLPGPPPNMQPVPANSGVSAHFPDETHLGVDDAGTLTAMFIQDIRRRGGMGSENYDLVLSDRPVGRAWPPDPYVPGTATMMRAELAVNASGAAVVTWQGFDEPLRVSYRPAAGAAWDSPQLVTPDATFAVDVGIDDAGRVVMLYGNEDQEIAAIRGTPGTGWSQPTPLAGNDHQLEVAAGGAALVTVRPRLPGHPPLHVLDVPIRHLGSRRPTAEHPRPRTGRRDRRRRPSRLHVLAPATPLHPLERPQRPVGRAVRPHRPGQRPVRLRRGLRRTSPPTAAATPSSSTASPTTPRSCGPATSPLGRRGPNPSK